MLLVITNEIYHLRSHNITAQLTQELSSIDRNGIFIVSKVIRI